MDKWVGQDVPRAEGREKVTGAAVYIDDLEVPGVLCGATIRSPEARGRIKGIYFEGDIPWDEFVIVTAADIPGANHVTLLETDQPFLASGHVNHVDEAVVLIAHADSQLVMRARRHVRVEVEPLAAVLDLDAAADGDLVVWGADNIFKEYRVERGDVDSVWDSAHLVVEAEYRTGAQEQLYIEPQGMVATASPEDGVVVRGSMQCPYYIQKALGPLFGLPAERIRVIQEATGGGFGGKEEYPSMVAGHAALLAWKSGKSVKILYDREEDIAVTTKRHPSRTRHRTAVAADGRLLAMEVDFVIDGGAYLTLSPVVLSRGTIHCTGPYLCENVRIRARAVATNVPPHGAFRGFGAPQSIFAVERQLDCVAGRLGMDPVELRRRNFLKTGDRTAVDQEIRERIDLGSLLDQTLTRSDYAARREACAAHNASGGTTRRGIGLATFYHGSGFTGAGEVYLASRVGVKADTEGRVEVLASSTEIGQGSNTIFAQIAADALGVDLARVRVAPPDTANVPDSGPTVASRTCMIVGKLVQQACEDLVRQLRGAGLLADGHTDADFGAACAKLIASGKALEAVAQYEKPPDLEWDEQAFCGDAYGAYSWAAYVAEVEVDTLTYQTSVVDFVAVQEVGTVIHPTLAAGQIEGGVAQGIGHALYEKVLYDKGRVQNGQMTNYIMPTAVDTPPIHVVFLEEPYAHGPAGAKGIGELPMDGPCPAIAAAIENATGCQVTAVPLLPEDLRELMVGGPADE